MSDGYVQQIGTPIELYDNPVNLFVASFIGLPPMNFIDVTVNNGKLTNSYLEVPVPDRYKATISAYEGKTVVLGIRPEDIVVGSTVELTVDINENLGQNTLVHGLCKKKKITCKFKEWAEYKRGDILKVDFKSEKIHLFDKETTKVIATK